MGFYRRHFLEINQSAWFGKVE